jgi:hypothetical protein
MTPKHYDTTVALMAAVIYGHFRWKYSLPTDVRIARAVQRAREIVAEVQRTEPEKASEPR